MLDGGLDGLRDWISGGIDVGDSADGSERIAERIFLQGRDCLGGVGGQRLGVDQSLMLDLQFVFFVVAEAGGSDL